MQKKKELTKFKIFLFRNTVPISNEPRTKNPFVKRTQEGWNILKKGD